MRIVLADDHAMVRAGFRALLEAVGETVVGEAGDGLEAIEVIEMSRPDIAIVDVTMPGTTGFEVAARVTKLSPKTKVIALSMHSDAAYVAQCLRAGVRGYLLKGAGPDELRLALATVSKGGTFLSAVISKQVVDGFLRAANDTSDPLAGLTERQRNILQLIAEGRSTKEIASDLNLSVKTVETHRTHLMDRLGIRDTAGLVRFAIRARLVSADH
jgi:DNA-binding NarL/FixJ family response regulator